MDKLPSAARELGAGDISLCVARTCSPSPQRNMLLGLQDYVLLDRKESDRYEGGSRCGGSETQKSARRSARVAMSKDSARGRERGERGREGGGGVEKREQPL